MTNKEKRDIKNMLNKWQTSLKADTHFYNAVGEDALKVSNIVVDINKNLN